MMHSPGPDTQPEEQVSTKAFPFRRSIFWRAAMVLVGLQILTGLLAIGLTAFFARTQSLDLAATSIRLRLDGIAEEIEARADLDSPPPALGELLELDVASRFVDPVFLLSPEGEVVRALPAEEADATPGADAPAADTLRFYMESGEVTVRLNTPLAAHSWGLVPLYDSDDFLAGGLLVQPLSGSVDRELDETWSAFRRALTVTVALAGLLALILGVLFTWWLVRPVRRITRQVEKIGRGDYSARVPVRGKTELSRLGQSVNRMAEAVERSVDTLQTTDLMRRELVANVGHDLRTPLTAMRGYIEEASRYLAEDDQPRAMEALRTAERQADRLRSLVNDLFELSLLETIPPPLYLEPVPLSELLSDAFKGHRSRARAAGIDISLGIEGTLPTITADGRRILRAMDNLLENAIRHTPSGGSVAIRGSTAAERVIIEVEDSGPGMDSETRERIFERHYTGDPARTRSAQSAGLGLPIARAIVEAHRGTITVESAPGEGSTFRIELPDSRSHGVT